MAAALNGVRKWAGNLVFPSGQKSDGLKAHQKVNSTELFPYTRPSFLGLSKEAAKASADHEIRPILVAQRELPLNAGYSETINAGKTYLVNEDQAFAELFCLHVISIDEKPKEDTITKLPYWCFGIFDGHAGAGAALAAVNQLQDIIHEKLHEIQDVIVCEEKNYGKLPVLQGVVAPTIDFEAVITGALEQSFLDMDNRINKDRSLHKITGGCTAVVSLFMKNKLFLANAGDSRAIICKDGKPIPVTKDHTPETDRCRLQVLAGMKPHLLGNEFTRLEFQQKPRRKHIGKKLFFRDRNMTGWALKNITEEDVFKTQMISGSGKSARLLETIGTTRGFGDFDLKASYTGIPVKPFLTPEPEVTIYDLSKETINENDVLIMATDGLWERVSNEKACKIVQSTFTHCDVHEKRRYSVAAQNLVMAARGRNTQRGWRISRDEINFNDNVELKATDPASYDDISVFVIPLSKKFQEQPETVQYPVHSIPAETRSSNDNGMNEVVSNLETNGNSTFRLS
ncbi:protein phosphatase 1H-like [Dendronephthya gigantea]|uniref:protein phosphatase 1H-like n=1 Tax=Dendronephthya gigantea TaxID=151771 RepID=UPI001069344F|nr:protein phosphatase 1H-like [Dendronephthya gigantea]